MIDDRYEVLELVGSGAMAQVYRAEHVHIRCQVAIKVIHPALAAVPAFARRFEREAVAIGKLDHPNCVSVLDFGRLPDGGLYLAMQFMRGPTLADALTKGALSPLRALHVARHVVSGLAHAHAAGIIHRDIKPANVMLAEYEGDKDFARILDFGVAKLAETLEDDGSPLTRIGERFGTPQYMSPEQSVGADVDARTDLYSVAVMLYQMLTGTRPFESGDPMALLAKQANQPAPTLADAGAGKFSPELERLVARGLAKRADDRYPSAAAFIAELDRCADQLRGVQREPPALASPWWRTRRGLIGAGAVALAVVAIASYLLSTSRGAPAAKARQLLSDGKPQAAVEYLEGRDDIADHAPAQLQLGHAYAAVRNYRGALDAYRRAVFVDSANEGDARLRQNLMVMLESDVEVAESAARLLIEELDHDEARDRVVEHASRHDELAFRTRMRALSEELGLGDRIDRVRSYKLDLLQAKKCDDRRAAIAGLRALEDPAAVPALERARARKGNRCLERDAKDAILYLEAQAPSADASAD